MTRRGNNFLGLSFVPSGMRHSPALPNCSTPRDQAPLVAFSGETGKREIPQAAANRKSVGTGGICEMRFSPKAGGKQTFKLLPLLVQPWTWGSTCCIFIYCSLNVRGTLLRLLETWLLRAVAVLQQQLKNLEMLLLVWPFCPRPFC